MVQGICQKVGNLIRDQRGAAMVEFALVLPLMFLIIGMVIEGSRIMWSFQSVISGVRDASRYLARVAPADTCIPSLTAAQEAALVDLYDDTLTTIVQSSLRGTFDLIPGGVSLKTGTKVVPDFTCISQDINGVGFSISTATIASVTATITITLPFSGFLELIGDGYGDFDVNITDEHRIFGA